MPVIGTAGHVDHGKSTLVRALTGLEPDRWEEERRRGLTIDLGFAWITLEDGPEVSFVDVPGHEQFIKNMLSGIEAVDIAMLVVAADEGWMPQTEEHVAILDLLDIDQAVIALTKTDRVDQDLIELAKLEIDERVRGTSIEPARIIEVAAIDGTGLEELRAELRTLVTRIPNQDRGRPRLWVDRVFTVSGSGTVVTGTLLDGSISVGDRLAVWPGAAVTRVRSLQAHEQTREIVGPGTRTAINLAGIDYRGLSRGSMLGRPDQWSTSDRILVAIRPARYHEELTNRGAYHLHLGSGSWPIRLRMLDHRIARIDLPVPLPLRMGDRFVIRETGRRLVVGGGRVLETRPPSRRRDGLAAAVELEKVLDGPPNRRADALLSVRGQADATSLSADSAGGTASGLCVGETVLAPWRVTETIEASQQLVTEFHDRNPLRPGLPLATLAASVGLTTEVLAAVIDTTDALTIEGTVVRAEGFEIELGAEQRAQVAACLATLDAAGWSVPRLSELDLDPELLHGLLRDGRIQRVGDEFVYPTDRLDTFVAALAGLEQPFTASAFKAHLGISRKHAIPLLEWADGESITIRSGQERRLRS